MPPDETETPNPNFVPVQVAVTKRLRKELDATLQTLKEESTIPKGLMVASGVQHRDFSGDQEAPPPKRNSRERSIAITKIQEAIMWLGMDLKAMHEEGTPGTDNPYPKSYDPSSPVIEKTADRLKL